MAGLWKQFHLNDIYLEAKQFSGFVGVTAINPSEIKLCWKQNSSRFFRRSFLSYKSVSTDVLKPGPTSTARRFDLVTGCFFGLQPEATNIVVTIIDTITIFIAAASEKERVLL